MQVFSTFFSIRGFLHQKEGGCGFVATMGALHDGHLELVKKSMNENKQTCVSIFVNPTQFNNITDLKNYPRPLKEDLRLLKEIGVDAVFTPSPEEVYPEGYRPLIFDFNGLDERMEGAHRPGHFQGMANVVYRLLTGIQPTKAYFGEKDFQQFRLVQEMVKMKNLSVEIVPCSIVRSKDGLALSSRNKLLSNELKKQALVIHNSLLKAKEIFSSENWQAIFSLVEGLFKESSLELEYFEITDVNELKPIKQKFPDQKYRAFIAAYAGEVRLIDNMEM